MKKLLIFLIIAIAINTTTNAQPSWNGDGTEISTWEIHNIQDLQELADSINTRNWYSPKKYFILMDDITDSVTFSIGHNFPAIMHRFNHQFDGNNKKITLNITNGRGTFGYVDYNAVIKNLSVDGIVNWNSGGEIGGIVGGCAGTGVGGLFALIQNCTNYANVISYNGTAGGIAGRFTGSIIDCINYGTVINGVYTAGIVAFASNYIYISKCINAGEILNGSNSTGGIVAAFSYANDLTFPESVIEKCINIGTVVGVGTYYYVAGIAGSVGSRGIPFTIHTCINYGLVRGICSIVGLNGGRIGGIVGMATNLINTGDNILIDNCISTGVIEASDGASVGAICGYCP